MKKAMKFDKAAMMEEELGGKVPFGKKPAGGKKCAAGKKCCGKKK